MSTEGASPTGARPPLKQRWPHGGWGGGKGPHKSWKHKPNPSVVSVSPSAKWGDYTPEKIAQKHVMFFTLKMTKEDRCHWLS